MTHNEKVSRVIEELAALGVSKATVAPPIFHLFWKIGLRIPPPLFLGFVPVALLMGSLFGLMFGAFMWLAFWQHFLSLRFAAFLSIAAGVLFGALMAAYLRWKARQLNLPPWHEYTPKG